MLPPIFTRPKRFKVQRVKKEGEILVIERVKGVFEKIDLLKTLIYQTINESAL
jgi:hypothetical protein